MAAKERGERDELEETKKALGEAKKKMTILEKKTGGCNEKEHSNCCSYCIESSI